MYPAASFDARQRLSHEFHVSQSRDLIPGSSAKSWADHLSWGRSQISSTVTSDKQFNIRPSYCMILAGVSRLVTRLRDRRPTDPGFISSLYRSNVGCLCHLAIQGGQTAASTGVKHLGG
jgi:hypothetical protein